MSHFERPLATFLGYLAHGKLINYAGLKEHRILLTFRRKNLYHPHAASWSNGLLTQRLSSGFVFGRVQTICRVNRAFGTDRFRGRRVSCC